MFLEFQDLEIIIPPVLKTKMLPNEPTKPKKQFDFADILTNMNNILKPVGAEVQMKRKNPKTGQAEETNQEEAIKITNFRIQAAAAQHAMKELTYEERKEWLIEKKNEGNTFFQNKDYEKACEMYMQAISALTTGESLEEKKDALVNIQIPLVNNLAACYAELGKFSKVAALSNEVLRLDNNNLKATLRMGHALLELREHKDAKIILEKAIELSQTAVPKGSGEKVARKAKKLLRHLNQSMNRDRKVVKKMIREGLGEMYQDKKRKTKEKANENEKEIQSKELIQTKEDVKREGYESDISSIDTESDDDAYQEGTLVGHFGSNRPSLGQAIWSATVERCCSCWNESDRRKKKKEELKVLMKKVL